MKMREMNLRVFRRQPVSHVFFQPRLEPWFFWHKTFESLPERCRDMTVSDLYLDLGASSRYFSHFTGLSEPVATRYGSAVRRESRIDGQEQITAFQTPYGELVEKRVMTVDRIWRKIEFAVKTEQDLRKLEWLFENSTACFSAADFRRGRDYQGDDGQPQFWILGSPYTTLTQEWMSFEDFMLALVDVPDRMERVMRAIDRSYDGMFEEIVADGDVKIVNFPENIHVVRTPPDYFQRYLIPWYQARSNQLRRSGIFTHIHIDGDFKPLLKYLEDLPFDGFEALTPLPQGDVTLEEIKEHIGDRVLLDGIPAILFLDHYPADQLQECVEKVVRCFHPRLVLGISDELPQGGNEASLDRVRWIADFCRNML